MGITSHQSSLQFMGARPQPSWGQPVGGALLLLLALCLYALTLDNGLQPEELVGGDLITHQYAQVQARPSNAPGYPLYTMGGWLWFHGGRTLLEHLGIDRPNPLPLLSSYSTLWALLALWLLYQILCRLTRTATRPAGHWPLAMTICLFYATTYFFWYYATTTEQYSSAIAQTLAIVYGYLRWRDHIRAAVVPGDPAARRRLYLLALLCGLSLAHMLTVAFIVPGVVAAVLWEAPWLLRQGRTVAGAVVAAFLPLVSYSYVYWRGVTHPEWWGAGAWSSGQAWFWAFVSTAQGREELGWGFAPSCTFFANGFPALIGRELSWVVVALGVIGFSRLDRRLATLLYSTLLIYLGFSWAYRCGNWFQVMLPAYALLMLGVGALLHRGWQWVSQHSQTAKNKRLLAGALAVLLVAPTAWNLQRNWAAADSRNRPTDHALDHATQLLAQPLPAASALFAAVDDALALQYLTTIWGIRPDLTVVSSQVAAQWIEAGRAVYSTWAAAPTLRNELPATLRVTSMAVDPVWIRFAPAGSAPAMAPAVPLNQPLTAAITLTGYTFVEPPPTVRTPASALDLTLFWQVDATGWPADVAISVRPTQGGAQIRGADGGYRQEDRPQPAQGLGDPTAMRQIDPYRLTNDPTAPTTIDGALVVLYRQTATGFENLAVVQLNHPRGSK